MSLLFALALTLLAVSSTVGYGAVCFAAALGPASRRLDAIDASAIAQVSYRVGARGNERACLAVGPIGLAAVALSDGRVAWSAPWLWLALALWALTVALRLGVVQPARRAALVILGDLAGARGEHEARRAQLGGLARRMQAGSLAIAVLFVAACAAVAVGATG